MTIDPIQLTIHGEILVPYAGAKEGNPEEHLLSVGPIGIHAVCLGFIDMHKVSTTANALVCRVCNLRVVIPKLVTTWKQLQAHIKFVGW